MNKALILSAAMISTVANAQAVKDLPPVIKAVHAEAVDNCPGGRITIGSGYVWKTEFNRDEKPDYVLDMSRLTCSNSAPAYCGSHGCGVTVFLSRGTRYVRAADLVLHEARLSKLRGRTVIRFSVDSGTRYWGWNGKTFDIFD